MGHGNSGGAPRPFDRGQCCVKWAQKLNSAGLRGVTKMATPEGSGRRSTSHEIDDAPVIDGHLGVLQCTVVEEHIAGLLPLSFQENKKR